MHSLPLYFGDGLEQLLCLNLTPFPHVTEQALNVDHSVKPPSTGKRNNKIIQDIEHHETLNTMFLNVFNALS